MSTQLMSQVTSNGLPVHDLVAYVAAGIAVLACVLAVLGTREVVKRQRKIGTLYRELIEHVTAEECARVANRAELLRERQARQQRRDAS